jgi:hypothetical protein
MAEEVADEAREEDVEGQVLRTRTANRKANRNANRTAPEGSDAEPKMTDSDDDVEGQSHIRTRNT